MNVHAPERIKQVAKGLVLATLTVGAAFTFGRAPVVAAMARGALAGRVFEKGSEEPLENVRVGALALISGEEFVVTTDSEGSYFVEGAPAGVYAFTLSAGGVSYPVEERLDVRVGMTFLLESCFELDTAAGNARVRQECDSGFVEEARVAQIGMHRFLRPQEPLQETPLPEEQSVSEETSPNLFPPTDTSEALALTEGLTPPEAIEHDEIECLTYEHFPVVDAKVEPGQLIQNARVYFRSDKYPDFYYVEMTQENPTIDDFLAVLPKPSPETETIYYYLQTVDALYKPLMSPEHDPEVLEVDRCDDPRAAALMNAGDPAIVIGATQAGASAIPPGFQALGITGFVNSLGVVTAVTGAGSAGGVASTTGLVLVVSGGAAATGATVAVTNDEEASPVR